MAAPLSKSVPPSLKKIVVFLRRAEELDHDKSPESRVVAYNCRQVGALFLFCAFFVHDSYQHHYLNHWQYAVLTGIPLAGSETSSKTCLGKLLDELEKEKSAMSTFSKSEHWAICRKMADRVFDKADGEDRSGMADKDTAKTFYAAGTFYEILQQFYEGKNDEDETKEKIEEEEQKRLYCKWKATEILNAIKEGREPIPGGYQQQQPEPEGADTSEAVTSSMTELPSPPEMPTSDLFTSNQGSTNSQSDLVAPPSYENVELNINGSLVGDQESDDIFIPAAPEDKVPATLTPSIPLPSPSSNSMQSEASIPAAPISPPKSSKFSTLFGKTGNKTKISKNQMNDAVELTKFALVALQKGDGELGRERLEQALSVLNK